MRFLHLADLHLGKVLHKQNLLEDQKYILQQILQIAEAHAVDAVLIAGDVYQRNAPSAEAMTVFSDFITELAKRKLPCYIISGNHDSAERIAFGSALMDMSGVHLSPVYDGTLKKHTLTDEHGEVDVYMLPFVRPSSVRNVFPDKDISSYTDAVKTALDAADVDFEGRRNVLISHQFVTGGDVCDSELLVGGLECVDSGVFEGFDYVALGHLHRPQSIGKDQRLTYSGTPLKYSLSEAAHKKTITIGELGKDGELTLSFEDFKPVRDLRIITGEFEEVIQQESEDYVHISLTDKSRIQQAGDKLRVNYPNMLSWNYESLEKMQDSPIPVLKSHEGRDPEEVFAELFELVQGRPMSAEQREITASLVKHIWEESV